MYERILILGFYGRNNIGDDAYTHVFPLIFSKAQSIRFISMDEICEIPFDIDIVVCGGGDLINDYFMEKAQDLLKNFAGLIYAVSVGLPYSSCTKYLHLFDHVFVRSSTDYVLACKEIGSRNVTQCPDASVLLPYKLHIKQNPKKKIGICLAQPYFYENPNKSILIASLITCLNDFYKTHNVEFHLFAFNFDIQSPNECDIILNEILATKLLHCGISTITHDVTKPVEMIEKLSTMDYIICMRYHSVMFSIIAKVPFMSIFTSQKIENLLKDIGYDEDLMYKMDVDKYYRPVSIDETRFSQCLEKLILTKSFNYSFDKHVFTKISNIIDQHKTSNLLLRRHISSLNDVLASMRRAIPKYLHMDVYKYDSLLYTRQPYPIEGKTSVELARFICFILSGKVHHPCLWGLSENLIKDDFCLYEAIEFIWNYCKKTEDIDDNIEIYYPIPPNFTRKVLLNLDFVFQNDFSQYHRSGWGYVIGSLMNLDAPLMLKTSDILLDTYIDRSFHWGFDILKTIGIIPYTKSWYGFIHHTYDTTHSEYNCIELFKKQEFIDSLRCCKGLLSLSYDLADKLRGSLRSLNLDVPVYVLYHPMEFVDNNFTIQKFLNNPQKKIVQIGAWLRNPYAIYELPLEPTNELGIQKYALKGKEMEQYFSPPQFMETMYDILILKNWYNKEKERYINRNMSYEDITSHDICRICRHHCNDTNKFCQGIFNMIERQINSVTVLEQLSNDKYDKLLSENIVFLNLVDCSAVNTVIECIVRNTVVIVNRLPALVEMLGENYPGFYNTLTEAAYICQDIRQIVKIYNYISLLDKSRYRLEFFIKHIQDIVESNGREWNYVYDLFNIPSTSINIFQRRYTGILRYLPRKYSLYNH